MSFGKDAGGTVSLLIIPGADGESACSPKKAQKISISVHYTGRNTRSHVPTDAISGDVFSRIGEVGQQKREAGGQKVRELGAKNVLIVCQTRPRKSFA